MNLILKKDRTIMGGTYILAVDSENNSTDLSFSIEDETLWGKSAFIEFLEQKKTTQGIKVSTTDGTFSYSLPNGLLQEGYVTMQVVIRGENHFVWKSLERIFNVTSAINISADMPVEYPDWLGEAQKILDGAASATGEIDEAVDKADTAVDNANIAIGKADTAIDKANTANTTANTAIDKANTAITNANEASDKALNVETEIEGKESLRETAEQSRATAEDTRKANEAKRQEDEATRNSNEDTRKSNETTRIADEKTRKSNETGRQNNETARKNNELTRQSAETIREENESARKADETARKNAETSRVSAENVRKQNEQDRETSEQSRVTAENNRVSAEDSRVAAEQERDTAEQARDSAETARKAQFDIWTDDITGMATKAELATETSERKTADNALKYRVKNLESANEGKTLTINTDSTAAYVKNNPDNCLDYGIVSKIYGRDRVCTNLLNIIFDANSTSAYGITFSYDPKSHLFSLTGTNTATADFDIVLRNTANSFIVLNPSTTYIVSDSSVIPYNISINEEGSYVISYIYSNRTSNAFTTSTNNLIGNAISIRIPASSAGTAINYSFYIWINKGSTALPYEPYFSGFYNNTPSKVIVRGTNYLRINDHEENVNGMHYWNDGNRIFIKGTATANTFTGWTISFSKLKKGQTYFFNRIINNDSTNNVILRVMYADGRGNIYMSHDAFVFDAFVTEILIYTNIFAGTTYDIDNSLEISLGSTALPYAPYTESTIDISLLGKTLHGIDLSNSTKCDELDLVNKTYTKRVGSRAYQEGDDEDASVITDGTNTYYILDTPTVETLSITDDYKFYPSTSLGSLTFENDKKDDVLSEVATEVKVA